MCTIDASLTDTTFVLKLCMIDASFIITTFCLKLCMIDASLIDTAFSDFLLFEVKDFFFKSRRRVL